MNKIPTLFLGSGMEGITALDVLTAHPLVEMLAVVSQPDKPTGRKQEMTPSPIKQHALQQGLTVVTPDGSDSSYQKIIEDFHAEFAVCLSFGQFIPEQFLNSLPHSCLNVHYSLLPQLRGAIPVQAAILQGLKETGVTIQVMKPEMDVGPVIIQEKVSIASDDTTETLKATLIPKGAEMLKNILTPWLKGEISPFEQDESNATYCYMKDISRENAQIDWKSMDPETIERMVKALVPWPVAWTYLNNGSTLKLYKVSIESKKHSLLPGQLLFPNDQAEFATLDPNRVIRVHELQREGKTRVPGKSFMAGYKPSGPSIP